MFRLVVGVGLLTGLMLSPVFAARGADKPTKVEIGKRGKAATAFAEVPQVGSGTAFCIHPSGLFVTNEHVVRGARGEITLVLNPTLATQQVLKAKVVRADKNADLALLRVEGAKDLPSLQLGSADGIAELADVVACGFPLGKILATDKKEYPAVSVNAGSVTALRHKGGELQLIQVDVALNRGNSGGPVLDDNGKVIGVVVSGFEGRNINEAIPVNHLNRFLNAPDIAFVPPAVKSAELDKPVEFKAQVASLVPNAPEPKVQLILQAGDEKPREYPMKNVNGDWIATAPPALKLASSTLELSANVGSGAITGQVEDATLTVDGKSIKLSAVRKIEFGAKPRVTSADGKTLEGTVAGLSAVEIRLGDQAVKIDLTKTTQVTVRPSEGLFSVKATVVVTVDGKEIGRLENLIPVGRSTVAAGPLVPITPPTLTADKVEKKLPEVFDEAVLAGGGRYLIFRLPKLKKLAVFDVSEAKVTNYIPLAEEKAVFAAGLDAVVVGLPGAGRLERWSLTTFEREKNVSHVGELKGIIMGHAATELVAVDGTFLDPVTFRPLAVKYSEGGAYQGKRAWIHKEHPLFASAEGTTFGSWNPHLSPSYCGTRVIAGGEVKRYENANLFHTIPGPDGRWVYTSKGVVTRNMKYASADDEKYGYCLPATSGDYFFSPTTAKEDRTGGTFTVYHRGMKGPIGKLDKADHGLVFDNWDRDPYGPWRRVFFIPEAKIIVVLPVSNDRVVLHKFDLDDALEKSGLDYLFVVSQAPRSTKAGETLTYPIKVKAKNAKVTYQLDSGPKGMEVSAAGVVTWAVPADATGDQEVILTVRDGAGQEVFHTFTVKVTK